VIASTGCRPDAAGAIPAADALPANVNFLHPSVNGLFLQAPIGLTEPMNCAYRPTPPDRWFR
jgi:hypothetical protein